MKRLQSVLCALALALALSTTVLAGNIHGVSANAPGNIHGVSENAPGNIHGISNAVLEMILGILIAC